jgi:polar amino acid transport system permease protein
MLLLEYKTFLLEGLYQTLLLSLVVTFAGTLMAILFSFGLMQRSKFISRPFYCVVEVLRDIPLMVAVLLTYFVLPNIGVSLDPFWSSSLSISLWGGANGAQVIRGGLMSVPTAQRETAAAFGLRSWKGLIFVVLPQAMPVILPPYISLLTEFVQATSLGAVVGVHELFRSGQVLIEQSTISRGGSPAFLVYGFILVIYFVLCWLISRTGRVFENYFARPYARQSVSNRKSNVAAIAAKAIDLTNV